MGKSDQHKKLLERSGEKTLDFLIGVIWEGMSQKRHAQNSPYTMQASQVRFTWVYRGSKKKNFDIDFPAKLGHFKTLFYFHQKNIFFSQPTFEKITKIPFLPGAG